MRSLFVGAIGLAAAIAGAQFDGPAPLAWRWFPSSAKFASGTPLADGDSIFVCSGGRVYDIDRTTGNKVWQFPQTDPIPGTFKSSPILSQGVLVAVGDNKIVYGIDPTTGATKWSSVLPGSPMGQIIECGKYIVQEQSDNKLIALDPLSGKPVWASADPNNPGPSPYNVFDGLTGQIAAIGNDILYLTQKNEMHCLDSVTREENIWDHAVRFTQIDSNAQPIVFNNAIYIASGQFLISIDPVSGSANWQTPTGMNLVFPPAVSSQGVFAVADDGTAMVFGLTDGTAQWAKPIDLGSFAVQRPTVVGTKFIVPTTNGAINLIDPATGNLLWSYVVRPIGELKLNGSGNRGGPGGGAGPGGPGGLGGGPGGFGGGGGAGQGFAGGQNNTNNGPKEITELETSGAVVLAGTTLLIPVKDTSLLAFDPELGVDLTPPNTRMLFPTPGSQVSGRPPLVLLFRIRDEGTGVNEKTIKILIDGNPYDHEYKRDGTVYVRFSSEGKNQPLADGRHEITVQSTDWMGNAGSQTYALTIDNTLKPIQLPGQNNGQNGRGPGGPGKGGAPGIGGGGLGGGDGG